MSSMRFGSPTSASSAAHLVLSFSFFVCEDNEDVGYFRGESAVCSAMSLVPSRPFMGKFGMLC